MNTRPSLDRRIERWLRDNVADQASERLVDATRQRVSATKQVPVVAGMAAPTWRQARLLALVAATLVAVAAAAAIFGPGNRRPPETFPSVRPPLTREDAPDPYRIVRSTEWPTTTIAVPLAMAAGPDGLLYVLDTKPSVTVLDPASGRPVRSWGSQGTALGQFDLTRPDENAGMGDLVIGPAGRVYVADAKNRRIEIFEPDGTPVGVIGSPNDFERVHQLDVDPAGAVYGVDHDLVRLVKYDSDGRRAWIAGGTTGAAPFHVFSVIVLSADRVLVTRDGADRPILFDARTGTYLGDWGPARAWTPAEGRLDPWGNVVLYEFEPLEGIEVFDAGGNLLGGHYHHSGPNTDRTKTPVWGDVFWPAPVFPGDGYAYTFGGAGLLRLEVDVTVQPRS